jgi:ubiquitin carboxyl-terminal hydrolase 25/28
MTTPEMDIGEAYAIFSISDRTAKVDFDVMKTAIAFAPPESAEKMQKAYQMIEQDQAKNFNNQSSQSEVRRNEYPLETWPVGLRNIGNTCYLNSVLQFLFTIRPLRELILNCEDKLQDPSPAAISGKVVGREAVTAERVEVAQKCEFSSFAARSMLIFLVVHELRTFFQHMITAPTDTVQPDIDLAALALCKTTAPQAGPKSPEASTDRNKNLGSTEGPVIGPMPMKDDDHADTVDSVMGDDKSDTSMKAMDLRDEPKEGEAQSSAPPEPPNRPPPIPPRPTATKSKLGNIEESARQQDAAEVLSNIFNLISCALQGESVVRENEQWDIIKRLFFSDVTSVRMTKPKPEEASELRDHFLVSPGWRDRNIYATLDDDFGLSELEGEVPRFEFVAHPAAIQIINLRRLQFDRVKGEQVYDRSHIALEKTLYMDRYLGKTQSLPQQELLKLRHVQWDKQRQLRTLEERRDSLRKTDIEGLDLPDVLDETSAWLSALEKEYAQEGDDSLPTPPPELADSLSEKASQLKKDLEGITTDVTRLEAEVENVFQSARDYPYRLHAVFTHRGGTKGGHYWIYIFDFQTNSWRKYNDDLVTPAKEEEVLNMHAELASMQPASTGVVYIRESMVDELTEAVKREPLLGDVEMKDADEEIPALVDGAAGVKYGDVQVLEGVEMTG